MTWGLLLIWAGAIMLYIGAYRLGKSSGHIDGHYCEAAHTIIRTENNKRSDG